MEGTPVTIEYSEGAEVGHRWFAIEGGELRCVRSVYFQK